MKETSEIIARMEEAQQRFNPFPSLLVSAENERRLQLQDRKPSYWDRIMSDPNRRDRYDDALLEAHMESLEAHTEEHRAFDGEDAENWQYHGPAEMEDQ